MLVHLGKMHKNYRHRTARQGKRSVEPEKKEVTKPLLGEEAMVLLEELLIRGALSV
jgi:hypothetical protein